MGVSWRGPRERKQSGKCHSRADTRWGAHSLSDMANWCGKDKNERARGSCGSHCFQRLLCDPREYSLSGFSVYGIFQARVLEWGASAFSVIHSYKCNFRVYCWVKFYDFISSFYIFLFKVISWFCFVLFCSWNLTLSGDIMKLIVFYTYLYCI